MWTRKKFLQVCVSLLLLALSLGGRESPAGAAGSPVTIYENSHSVRIGFLPMSYYTVTIKKADVLVGQATSHSLSYHGSYLYDVPLDTSLFQAGDTLTVDIQSPIPSERVTYDTVVQAVTNEKTTDLPYDLSYLDDLSGKVAGKVSGYTIITVKREAEVVGRAVSLPGDTGFDFFSLTLPPGSLHAGDILTLTSEIPGRLESDPVEVRVFAVAETVARSKEKLSWSLSQTNMPTTDDFGSTISWWSSNPDVITTTGNVYPSTEKEENVTLRATITRGDASDTKEFNVTVPQDRPYHPELYENSKFFFMSAPYSWLTITIKNGETLLATVTATGQERSTYHYFSYLDTSLFQKGDTVTFSIYDPAKEKTYTVPVAVKPAADKKSPQPSRITAIKETDTTIRGEVKNGQKSWVTITKNDTLIGQGVTSPNYDSVQSFFIPIMDGATLREGDPVRITIETPGLLPSDPLETIVHSADYSAEDDEAVNQAVLWLQETMSQVTYTPPSVYLPTDGIYDTTISWWSSNPDVISPAGEISPPKSPSPSKRTAPISWRIVASTKPEM